MPEWTQDESIAYECACEVITHMRAILTGEMEEELQKPNPDKGYLQQLNEESLRLFHERENLQVKNQDEIARIRSGYGARVRAWFDGDKSVVATV